jgi:starch synthase (maltosyl-transferring)
MQQVRIVIENVTPRIDCGRFAAKAVVGDKVEVAADIWKDGHELLRAAVLWRKLAADELSLGSMPAAPDRKRLDWRESVLLTDPAFNDRWYATISPHEVGPHAFTVVAWTDRFGSFVAELNKKVVAGQEVSSELLEGLHVIDASIKVAHGRDRVSLIETRHAIASAKTMAEQVKLILDPLLAELIARCDPREDLQSFSAELPLWVDRERGRFGAWYEIFPRSQGTQLGRSATFAEAEARLPEIAAMGFDVLYLAPIHPIGHSHRKGPNNSEECQPGDPGSPWAIGADEGGHDSIHPELGTLADFDHWRWRAGWDWRSRSTLRCSVRPITLGWGGTRTGSASGRTEPSSTPRIRPRSIKTSSPSISTRRIVRDYIKPCSMSCCSG